MSIVGFGGGTAGIGYIYRHRVDEGVGTHDVTLTVSPAPVSDIKVTFGSTGSATPGSDYETLPYTVTIPKGATKVTVPVKIIDDDVREGAELIILVLAYGPGYDFDHWRQYRHTGYHR